MLLKASGSSSWFIAPPNACWECCWVLFIFLSLKIIRCRLDRVVSNKTYLQNLQTDGWFLLQVNTKSISRALLLLTASLIMGATCVVSSPCAPPPAEAVHVLVGTGRVSLSSSSEGSKMSRFMTSSMGAGWAGAGWLAGLDREQGAMLRMCIEDVAEFLSYIEFKPRSN